MQPSSTATRRFVFAAVVLALGLIAPPPEAAERRSASGDRGKSTASRGSSSSGGSSASQSSSSPGRGSRAAARARSGSPRGSSGSPGTAGSAASTRAVRGTGSGTQVAVGRATYGHGYYGSSYGIPYYHYRPYYSYPSWWIGSYGWAYYDAPGAYFASVGWPYAWSTYCWPAYYDAWAFSGSGRPHADEGGASDWDTDRSGTVELDIVPKKARVVLNGDDIGIVKDYNGRWDQLYLQEGVHRIDFEYPGYQTFRVYLEVRPGREYRVEERLERGDGLDARSMEEPKPKTPPRPMADAHRAEPMRDGALDPDEPDDRPQVPRTRRTELDFEGFEPPSLESPTLLHGLLRIEVEPADAAIYLDGKFLARAGELTRLHGALPVAAGRHELEIVHPDFRTQARTVDVEAGREPTEIRIRLARE